MRKVRHNNKIIHKVKPSMFDDPAKMAEPVEMPFGCEHEWTQESMHYVGCTLAPPGEYH